MENILHKEASEQFVRLLEIMERLRAECPWDKKQNNESLRSLTIEETFELSEAIVDNNTQEIKNELGDLLLHIVFYSKIGSESNDFNIKDVINDICDKLIFRHPHIYGDVVVEDEEEVKRNWESLKLKEGRKSVFEGVPKSLTGLLKSYRIQEKAAGVGFEWKKKEDVWEKVNEELLEWKEELNEGNKDKMEAEFCDLLFSMVNYARFLNINPDDAIERTNRKFIRRFQFIEDQAKKDDRTIDELSFKEMESLYQTSKKKGL